MGLIYLNPIFEAHSNHRYDTADCPSTPAQYRRGFRFSTKKAEEYGIKSFLTAFSAIRERTVYFNNINAGDGGAYNDPESPYSWYKFEKRETTTPLGGASNPAEVNENEESFKEFLTGDREL